jgi:hypothetical protein
MLHSGNVRPGFALLWRAGSGRLMRCDGGTGKPELPLKVASTNADEEPRLESQLFQSVSILLKIF